MRAGFPGRRQVRRFLEWSIPPSLRLPLFRAAARALPPLVGPAAFLRLADEFTVAGRERKAMACWRILQRMAPGDTRILGRRLQCALEAGDADEVQAVIDDSAAGAGVSPSRLAWIAGYLALHGQADAAGRMLDRLAAMPGGGRHVMQAPSIVSGGMPDDLDRVGMEPRELELVLARLCFTFGHPDIAAALFERAEAGAPLAVLDRVAKLHAQADGRHDVPRGRVSGLRGMLASVAGNPDALGMLAKVALVAGEDEVARNAVRQAVLSRYSGSDGASAVAADCVEMVDILAALRGIDESLPAGLRQRGPVPSGGIPKVFLCGFGWSGSGAVYDDIRGVRGFCEFEGSGRDPIINEDADSEVAFVQGPGGLGDLWRRAVEDGSIPWSSLWDMFSLHVAGIAPIGYARYKCASAARNNVLLHGVEYTGSFKRLLAGYAGLRRAPFPGGLQLLLAEATESLCGMLVRHAGSEAVLFNNAIFGRQAMMLEIFRAHRAAMVYRDPRDVYVDRRDKDRNHWRTPAQLATFYAHGLRSHARYRKAGHVLDPSIREVRFEQFVLDDDYRRNVRGWLLGSLGDHGFPGHFDPAASRANIGIHRGALTQQELEQLHDAVVACRELDGLQTGYDQMEAR